MSSPAAHRLTDSPGFAGSFDPVHQAFLMNRIRAAVPLCWSSIPATRSPDGIRHVLKLGAPSPTLPARIPHDEKSDGVVHGRLRVLAVRCASRIQSARLSRNRARRESNVEVPYKSATDR